MNRAFLLLAELVQFETPLLLRLLFPPAIAAIGGGIYWLAKPRNQYVETSNGATAQPIQFAMCILQ